MFVVNTGKRNRKFESMDDARQFCSAVFNRTKIVLSIVEVPDAPKMRAFNLYWSPEGKLIATVQAKTPRAAVRKAPKPYRKYLGEIYAVEVK